MSKKQVKSSPQRKRKSAKAAAPRASSVETNPAAPVRRLGDAMLPDLRKAKLITLAMDMHHSRRKGPPSGAWKLGVATLFQVACRNLIDGDTAATICQSIDKDLRTHRVPERAMYRWLESVRESYWVLLYRAVEKQATEINFESALNDPESAVEMLMALLAARTQEMLSSKAFAELNNDERHLCVRAYRETIKTLESLARNRTSKAQSEKIISTIRAAADACDRGGVRISEGRAGGMLRELLEGKMPKELGGGGGGGGGRKA
jgi:hypothetical protein